VVVFGGWVGFGVCWFGVVVCGFFCWWLGVGLCGSVSCCGFWGQVFVVGCFFSFLVGVGRGCWWVMGGWGVWGWCWGWGVFGVVWLVFLGGVCWGRGVCGCVVLVGGRVVVCGSCRLGLCMFRGGWCFRLGCFVCGCSGCVFVLCGCGVEVGIGCVVGLVAGW